MMIKYADSIVEPMENGPFWKKCTSKSANSIAQTDVFEENMSEKGSKMAQTLIKPMENHQTRPPESIFLYEVFFCTYKLKVSHIWIWQGIGESSITE